MRRNSAWWTYASRTASPFLQQHHSHRQAKVLHYGCVCKYYLTNTFHTQEFHFIWKLALVLTETLVHEDWEHSTHHYSNMLWVVVHTFQCNVCQLSLSIYSPHFKIALKLKRLFLSLEMSITYNTLFITCQSYCYHLTHLQCYYWLLEIEK